jgi:hypothetical protein
MKLVKVKGKIFPVLLTEHQAMKAYWRSGGIAPLNLTSALDGGEWSASHPTALPSGREPRYPLDRRLDANAVVKRKIPSPPGIEP